MSKGSSWFNMTSVALGLAFLYLPIVILVIYSFNDSKLVTVWGGWSTRWYAELFHGEAFMNAAKITLIVATVSATIATVLGTLAAVVLVRMGRFRGRMTFSAMVYAPLVMPEIIIGLSLLLFFISLGVDRGCPPALAVRILSLGVSNLMSCRSAQRRDVAQLNAWKRVKSALDRGNHPRDS